MRSIRQVGHHFRRYGLVGAGTVLGLIIVVQLAYPWQNLPLYATIDGVPVGGQAADKAIKSLDDSYGKVPITLYFGNSPKAYRQPLPKDIGLTINSKPQVDAQLYPWWLRLVPTSLWWAHAVTPSAAPFYARDPQKAGVYIQKELGESCNVTAQNASLMYKDKKLQVIPAIDGGTCKLPDVEKLLNTAMPRLHSHTVRIPMDQHPAVIHEDAASRLAADLMVKTKSVSIQAGNTSITIPQDTFLSWLDFTAPDSGIVATVNADRSADFFAKQLAPKVAVKPGVSQVTTLDFAEISRVDGALGQALDAPSTLQLLNQWLGGADSALVVQAQPVAPIPVYTRTYTQTDTGLTALLTQFAQAHPGTFGVSYAELDGDHRHAGYQDTRIFETASTFKLFVAYSTLKRIESGQFHWSDQIQGGRDLTKCFDDMIVNSDNACAEALLNKIGYATITHELQAIGMANSSFLGNYIQSTPADEATLLGALQSGQLLSPSSTSTLLSAMKRNIYRQGIPAGTNATVADKVGFLYALLHDASVVYSPSGTYVLVIMTDHSNWSTIADLTRQIETWRAAA